MKEKIDKKHKVLKYKDRHTLEVLLKRGTSKKEIADEIGVSLSTIYKEIKKGLYTYKDTMWNDVQGYSCDIAQDKTNYNVSSRGSKLKIEDDIKQANYIEKLIVEEKYSPQGALYKVEKERSALGFTAEIKSVNTIYSYIDKGVFLSLSRSDLPCHKKYKKKKTKKIVIHRKKEKGYSIEDRPKEADDREIFGHWEGDTVKPCHGDKTALLVLSERKSRIHILEKLKSASSKEVCAALKRLERKTGANFYKIFKSITFDNGSEFSDYKNMEKATRRKSKRFDVYFAHPQAPQERGTNENNNKLIRRWLPKGVRFAEVSTKDIKKLQRWISEYPRRILNGKSSLDIFNKELEELGIPPGKVCL